MQKKTYPLYYGGMKRRFAKATIAGQFVFLSSMGGVDPETNKVIPGGIREHTKLALTKIKSHLEDVGSSMGNILRVVIYIRKMEAYEEMADEMRIFFRENCPDLIENPPAMSAVEGALPGYTENLVDIEVTAILS